jgi:ATP-dependent helicase IRC3
MSAPTLRPYQHDALDAIAGAFLDGHHNRVLVKMPTGTGKTVAFAELLKWPRIVDWLNGLSRLSQQRGGRMLVIAHREELLDQAAAKISAANPGLMVSIEQGERMANRYSDVVVASIQTLSAMKCRRLKRLLDHHTFRIVIVDEAHHAAAASYRTALAHLGFLPAADISEDGEIEAATHDDIELMTKALEGWDREAPQDRLLVGVTATPNRSDAIGLGCVFQTIAYSYGLKTAIDDGWLVPIKPWVIETSESLDDVHIARGDFNQRELANAVNTPRRNALAVEGWKHYAGALSTIGFTVDVAHAHDLAKAFQGSGVNAKALSGETPKDERREMLAAYTRGDVQVLLNCMVLTEGTDLPRTGCILHAKPTKSATLYEQMTGRGLRLFPGKSECVVIDLVDVARRHSLQAAPVLYGLPPGVKTKGDDLRKVADEMDALREQYPQFNVDEALKAGVMSIEELRKRASTFDIWTVPSLGAFGNGRALNWIKSEEDVYRLQYPWQDGSETLQVSKDLLGHWEVVSTLTPHRDSSGRQAPKRQRTLAAQVDSADAAAGLAEAFVLQERRSVAKLKNTDAPWRQRPASEKQIALLRKLRVPFKTPITMGGASDLIDLANARRQQGKR